MFRKLILASLIASLSGGASASDVVVPFVNGRDLGTIFVSSGLVGPMNLKRTLGKTLSIWTAGDGGGIDIAGSIPAGAGGHVFVICCDEAGDSDVLLSASAYNPKLPAGFTQKQIVNSFLTDSSGNIEPGNWREDGSFELSTGRFPVQGGSLTSLHLVPTGMPAGTKMEGSFRVNAWDSGSSNLPFYGLLKDPDAYPTSRYLNADWNVYATYDKPSGLMWSTRVSAFGDEMGQILNGAASSAGATTFYNHVYLQGWRHPRATDAPTVSIGILGASLTMDRNANNWPNMMAARLAQGKRSRVRVLLAGKEGAASNYWLSSGWVAALARVRPHLVVLDMTADASAPQGVSVAQSLLNLYSIIDAIRASNPGVPIFLFKANRMRADATVFSNVLAYYANYDIAVASRPNIRIIDTYSAWGDPAAHPDEYATADPIHPLYAGNLRVTIPVVGAALAGYIE